jgi:putative nucleotidyltransferase with HDIG domain
MVSRLSACFAAFLGRPNVEQHALARAGLLHDIGKVKVPAAILNQPFSLTPEQQSIMRAHSQRGYELLLEARETDEILLTVVRDHHERLDGTGYPRRLTAEQISWSVRMVTLCDVFAAMTEPRPYANVMRWDEALERMAAKRTRLDLGLLSAFATMVKEMNVPKE